jgi:hypothetical protein
MTIENWLIIALIISTLIAPTIQTLVASLIIPRINQPKPTPETSQPKNRIQRMGGWLSRFLTSPWFFPPFGILFNIYLLFRELHITKPVTRETVFGISMAMAGIVLNALSMSMLFIWRAIYRQEEIIEKESELAHRLVDTVGSLSDSIKKMGNSK